VLLEVDGIAKRFGNVQAVREITFSVSEGEIVALLGSNGAGKSTAVKIIATLLTPDQGAVHVAGYDVVARPDVVRSLLGVALQQTGIPRHQSARRLLTLHARLHGMRAAEAAAHAEQLLTSLMLEPTADLPVVQLSGGARRRVDVALALVRRPALLLLDEPTVALDPDAKRAMWAQVDACRTLGGAVLFTTHDLPEAEQIADRVVIIEHGRVVEQSRPEELKRRFGSHAVEFGFPCATEAAAALAALPTSELSGATSLRLDLEKLSDLLEILRRLDAHALSPDQLSLQEPSLDSVYGDVLAAASSHDKRG
jgi:ABC-type multidrug transport system ATPase subunit